MPVSAGLAVAALSAAIDLAAFKNSGDATAAEPTSMNFLLDKFELFSVIKYFLLFQLFLK
jgi:hypothetical protein